MKTAEKEVDGVLITSYFTDKGAKAAALCLETAADAVRFYKEWLGFYPFSFLNIVPGGSGRWGGYPVATGIVAIHGLETYVDGESPRHWRHITSHEIGHQYWGEWILDSDTPSWLWIAGGIFADTEFMTARGFDPDRRTEWMGNYVEAIPMYYDMTLDAPPDREDAVKYDFNNTVVHSKGPAVIFALDSVLGRETFMRVYNRCLREFGGKRFGWRNFRTVAEAESGTEPGLVFRRLGPFERVPVLWNRGQGLPAGRARLVHDRNPGETPGPDVDAVSRPGRLRRRLKTDGLDRPNETRHHADVSQPDSSARSSARSGEKAGPDRRAPAEDLGGRGGQAGLRMGGRRRPGGLCRLERRDGEIPGNLAPPRTPPLRIRTIRGCRGLLRPDRRLRKRMPS